MTKNWWENVFCFSKKKSQKENNTNFKIISEINSVWIWKPKVYTIYTCVLWDLTWGPETSIEPTQQADSFLVILKGQYCASQEMHRSKDQNTRSI